MLFSEENDKLGSDERNTKFKMLISKINKSNRRHMPAYVIRTVNGRIVAHFNRACNMDEDDLKTALAAVRNCKNLFFDRTNAEKVNKLVDAIVELESLRDDEWDFEERNGPNRDCWDEETSNEHDELVGMILGARYRVRDLCREITGKKELEV